MESLQTRKKNSFLNKFLSCLNRHNCMVLLRTGTEIFLFKNDAGLQFREISLSHVLWYIQSQVHKVIEDQKYIDKAEIFHFEYNETCFHIPFLNKKGCFWVIVDPKEESPSNQDLLSNYTAYRTIIICNVCNIL